MAMIPEPDGEFFTRLNTRILRATGLSETPESDVAFFARLDAQDASEKARLAATYPIDREPTTADLAEMARWSQSVQEHDEALQTWMEFFGDDEGKSTYYVS